MPTFRHGRGTKVFVDEEDLSGYFREATVSRAVDTAETSAYGTFDKTFVVGQVASTVTLAGMFDGSADAVDEELSAVVGQEADVLVSYCPEGAIVGRRCVLLAGKESTYDVSSPVTDVVAVSASFQGSGATRGGHQLHNHATAESAAGDSGSGIDNGAASTTGGVGHLHVTANSRNGASTIKVQHSVDNAVYTDLITFASVGAATKVGERVEVAGTVNRYVRGQWTPGGATGSISFSIGFARK